MKRKSACGFCGAALTLSDLQNGGAVVIRKTVYCVLCVKEAIARSRPMPSAARSERRPYRQATRRSSSSSPPAPAFTHACLLYSTPEERRSYLLKYVQEGIRKDEKIVYIADAPDTRHLPDFFKAKGIDVRRHVRSGQLVFSTASQLFAPDGVFKPEQALSGWNAIQDQAIRDGYSGFRGSAEMTWALRGWPGSEKIMDYEASSNSMETRIRMTALCQYDVMRFSGSQLARVILSHPIVLRGSTV